MAENKPGEYELIPVQVKINSQKIKSNEDTVPERVFLGNSDHRGLSVRRFPRCGGL